MTDPLTLVLAWLAGAVFGTLFFGGLWWTVRRALSAKRPALLFLGSVLVRTSATLAGFYLVAGSQWQRLIACLLGFVMARALVTRVTKPSRPTERLSTPEASRAP